MCVCVLMQREFGMRREGRKQKNSEMRTTIVRIAMKRNVKALFLRLSLFGALGKA